MRLFSFAGSITLFFVTSSASADRLAVIPLEAPKHAAPLAEADRLSADLIAAGHRVVASADALARIAGNESAGLDWATQVTQSIDAARAALTRLDRSLASNMSRRVGEELVHRGGGAGGADVLVEWCLLERQLALTASDTKTANLWVDAAVTFGSRVELDPLRHPDDERDLFARRRSQLQDAPPATLSMTSTPPAVIWVDGTKRCESPCTISLAPGRHLVRAASPAHAPAALDVTLAAGTTTERRVGLTAAYSGASREAIAAMLADPSRRAEGASALEPMARFLDVEHVIGLMPDGDRVRLVIAPPANGRSRLGPVVTAGELSTSVNEQLVPIAQPSNETPFLKKPSTWIIGAATVAAVVGGVLIYGATRSTNNETSGAITVR